MIGLVGQVDLTSPYTSGYMLIPRDTNDLSIIDEIVETQTSNSIKIYPNPCHDKLF